MNIALFGILALLLVIFLLRAGRRGPAAAKDGIMLGGLYAEKDRNGAYRVAKVLAFDDTTLHLRLYRNKFPTLPQSLDASTLSLGRLGDPEGFGVGHVPITRDGWLASQVFLKKEPLRDEELGGYRHYLEQMNR